ncbi:TIGR01777 family protein [Methylophaga sp. 42_8_T64]|nr:TIGR01777 family protein [Methylophaga sp. 41_12_T18]OUR89491.1 TIGR01777 family protein [Methylophaga sp. 42_8_T64]
MASYLITGGTGLIGTALSNYLLNAGHDIIIWTRRPNSVAKYNERQLMAISSLNQISPHTTIDGVINLAGAAIADRPWTPTRKAMLEQSRIALTSSLVDWLSSRNHQPSVLISGSAVGWYGNSGSSVLTESSHYHDEYTHQLCNQWEQQALRANKLGIRTCIVRTGLVLAHNGGFLNRLLLPFKMGLGGRLGSGQQYMSWIHLQDMIKLINFLLETNTADGVFNACSPSPVTNKQFTHSLAKQLRRPAIIPLPSWLLKLILGEMSCLLVSGQRVIPEKAQAQGFQFDYTELDSALADTLSTNKKNNT